jgi:N-acetylmuramoyl-L-alanine amidase
MSRSRPQIAVPSLLIATALTPLVATAALAADPTIVVERGDTLSGIALEHRVEVAELARINGLADPNRIYAGQTLRLAETPTAPRAPAAPASSGRTHTVHVGENLTWIARRYGVTIAAIVSANGIADPSRIFAGQRLTIPGSAPAATAPPPRAPAAPTPAAAAPPTRTHTVQPGENLTWIARRHGVTIAAIVSANGIADPSRIFAGQRLTIPTAPGSTAASPGRMPASMAALVARRSDVREVITEEAQRAGVPVSLALAVAWQESGWQQRVTSHAGAVGVMQLLPATADWVGEAMLGAAVDIRDTRSNVRAGVTLLAHYLAYYDGNRKLVLAAYYQGQAGTDRHGIYAMTRPYIASILNLEQIFAAR